MSDEIPAASAITDQVLLDLTRQAIWALTNGKATSYTINGRTVTKVDLPALWDQARTLEARIDAETAADGGFAVVEFRRPG